jgi:predicted TPR repeat methyltransferase
VAKTGGENVESGNRLGHSGLSTIPRKSKDVAKYYDNWAKDYDGSLAEWSYDAPKQVASILRAELSPDSAILDAGCGTGLSGKALRSAGFTTVDGIDVSTSSLEIAGASGSYRTLRPVDMQRFPLPILDGQYGGLACVGVFTYLTDTIGALREFSRVVKSGGIMVLTQRSDLFVEREFNSVLEELSREGLIEEVRISEKHPYLPGNEEFSDQILVHYVTCTVV